ncbi:MAG: alpha/beta hydrolase [Deltaproteobacteria bacterium]
MRGRFITIALALIGALAVAAALVNLRAARSGIAADPVVIDYIPATVYREPGTGKAPVVVIAHGFAGSETLMHSFAYTLARNGLIAITFDFAGHGRNPLPLAGDITEVQGATRTLVAETEKVLAYARTLGDGRVALLGHSMASDIIVRAAAQNPDVAASVAVSMFSPAVTREVPKNLLIIVGDWEGMLKQEALRATGLVSSPEDPKPAVTYGNFADGTARRAYFSSYAEHVGVLYRPESLLESQHWLDQAFGIKRAGDIVVAERGRWIALLFVGLALLVKPLTLLLPVVAATPTGAGLRWKDLWLPLLLPAIATPVILRPLPTHFLPVLVGDYLACHFALYGILTILCLWWLGRGWTVRSAVAAAGAKLALATVLLLGIYAIVVVWPINAEFTHFLPTAARAPVIAALAAGTVLYFTADEWLTRGQDHARGAYVATKAAFIVSLMIAVALDFERLFFLLIIVPVIVLFFLFFGVISSWVYARTRNPLVAGLANAVAIAWAIGVVFPMVAG